MAPGADPAFQQAMDKLMLQVDADNVLAVGRVFRVHADDLKLELKKIERQTTLGLCGMDPVSTEVLKDASIGGKLRELVAVHWRHWEELSAVAAALEDCARSYGFNEDHIRNAFAGTR
ncbi:MAG: hypothetical protein M3235_10245 [Actinomycetota bacterium]|nr:hypothetical protein [Actinomycetota bacterium]